MNLIEISPVVIEIRGAENSKLAVPVNNTLVSHTAFLAADTRPCVLILCLRYNICSAWFLDIRLSTCSIYLSFFQAYTFHLRIPLTCKT